jgi:hypothetical protein
VEKRNRSRKEATERLRLWWASGERRRRRDEPCAGLISGSRPSNALRYATRGCGLVAVADPGLKTCGAKLVDFKLINTIYSAYSTV